MRVSTRGCLVGDPLDAAESESGDWTLGTLLQHLVLLVLGDHDLVRPTDWCGNISRNEHTNENRWSIWCDLPWASGMLLSIPR